MILIRNVLKIVSAACCFAASAALCAAQTNATSAAAAIIPATTTGTSTNRLAPGTDDKRIAYVVARMLEQGHYLRHPLDDEYSGKFFDRYIDTLDPWHMHFTQTDLDQFASLRTNLDNLTLPRRTRSDILPQADTSPAFDIFNRFLERLGQRTEYVDSLLKTDKFEFNADERILADRREAPFPADLAEAKKLWRERIRLEYLQEKLAIATAKKKPDRAKKDSPPPAAEPSKESKLKTDAEEIADKMTRRYGRVLHTFKEWDNGDVLEVYLTALAHVYDPHSDYMNKSEADNFAITMSLSLFGIGATLTTDLDGYCKIQELKPGPAMKSGQIKPNDRIVAVAQGNQPPVDVVQMNLNKTVQLIRGPKGTEVRLTIIPADNASERRVVSLIRDEIKLEDQAAKAEIIDLPVGNGKTNRLGVIDLPSFYATVNLPNAAGHSEPKSTTDDVTRLLKKLEQEHVAGIILDLRRNGGGSLEEVVHLTGLFIKQGPVVQVRDPNPEIGVMVDGDDDPAELYDGPLVVLTDRFSASASEILAGALQDYGRALIVGDISTHGKGTVQNVNSLSRWIRPGYVEGDPGVLKLTIRKFYRASGASTQKKGVMPDIVLPSILNYSKFVGEDALENPLEWDTIPSVHFDKFDLVEPSLAELLRRSSERVATNEEFAYIRADIERFRKDQADKTISLNEKVRLKEMDELDAREKVREEERLARKAAGPVTYEIKLADVDKPGLPLPVGQTNALDTITAIPIAPAAATNSASVASSEIPEPGEPETQLDEEVWRRKAALEEAEHILADYVTLFQQKGPVIVKAEGAVK
jgi:carboxyl-terminal processing protease